VPFMGGFQYNVNNNRIVYVADVVIPTAYKIKVDTIDETTAGHGITILKNTTDSAVSASFGGP
jgi:hypothetical protein